MSESSRNGIVGEISPCSTPGDTSPVSVRPCASPVSSHPPSPSVSPVDAREESPSPPPLDLFVSYGKNVYKPPPTAILFGHESEPVTLDNADALRKILISKSDALWKKVQYSNVVILRNNDEETMYTRFVVNGVSSDDGKLLRAIPKLVASKRHAAWVKNREFDVAEHGALASFHQSESTQLNPEKCTWQKVPNQFKSVMQKPRQPKAKASAAASSAKKKRARDSDSESEPSEFSELESLQMSESNTTSESESQDEDSDDIPSPPRPASPELYFNPNPPARAMGLPAAPEHAAGSAAFGAVASAAVPAAAPAPTPAPTNAGANAPANSNGVQINGMHISGVSAVSVLNPPPGYVNIIQCPAEIFQQLMDKMPPAQPPR